jgi:hypothetical protein
VKFSEKYDKVAVGIITGFVLPVIVSLVVFLSAKGDPSLQLWLRKIIEANISTQIVSLCMFPNVLIFFLFNHFDMLRTCKGVLGITMVWLLLLFVVKVM